MTRDYSRHIAGGESPGNSKFPSPEIWQRELSTWAKKNRGMSNVCRHVESYSIVQLLAVWLWQIVLHLTTVPCSRHVDCFEPASLP